MIPAQGDEGNCLACSIGERHPGPPVVGTVISGRPQQSTCHSSCLIRIWHQQRRGEKEHYYSDKRTILESHSVVSMFKNGLETGEQTVCLFL